MNQATETERGSMEPGRGLPWFQHLQGVKHGQRTGAGGRGTRVRLQGEGALSVMPGSLEITHWCTRSHQKVRSVHRWVRLGKDWCLGYFLT